MKPLVDLVKCDPTNSLEDFHIIALMKHRDLDHLDQKETMKQGEWNNWADLFLIFFKETEKITEEFCNWLADQLSLFDNKPDSGYTGNKNIFVYQSSECEPSLP